MGASSSVPEPKQPLPAELLERLDRSGTLGGRYAAASLEEDRQLVVKARQRGLTKNCDAVDIL